MKKKILFLSSLVIFSLFIVGCGMKDMDSPTSVVEGFLGKYQSMDSSVLSQLDSIISNDTSMNDDQKKDYKTLMERQYQNLSYKIKDEEIDGDVATVDVEVEVFDYASSINTSREYFKDHQDEFKSDDSWNGDLENENGEVVGGVIDDLAVFIDFKIKELMDVTDKTKYDITFYLSKKDDKWVLDDLNDSDREKIHGLFDE